MNTDENVAVSADDAGDKLETINDIGPKFAKALYKSDIGRFADLAQCTPDELSKILLDKAGVKVSPDRIEAKNWIGQARELAEYMNTEHTPPEEAAEVANEP